MENSTRFLNAFINIEMTLKEILKINHLPFTQLVSRAKKKNKVVAYYEFDLIEYSQLRNAITHNRVGSAQEVIAEPHLSVVESIEAIEKALNHPTLLMDIISKDVFYVDLSDDLTQVIEAKKKTGYSVIPVYDDRIYVGTITEPMIARWMEDHFMDCNTQDLTIKKLLMYSKDLERVVFVHEKTSVFDAMNTFMNCYQEGHRIAAMIITPNGYTNEKPLRVLTLRDLPILLHEMV